MKRVFCVVIAVLLCAVCLFGCAKPEKLILGKWSGEASILGVVTQYSYEFREDGTGVMSTALNLGLEMHYALEGDRLDITTSVLGVDSTRSYTYAFEKEQLILTPSEGGDPIVLSKTE